MLKTLSSREREIFELLLKGVSPKQIAHKLNIKHSTVDFHRSKIYNKLGIHKIQELLAKYSTNGIETPAEPEATFTVSQTKEQSDYPLPEDSITPIYNGSADGKIAEKSAVEVYVTREEIDGTLIDDILNIKINMAEMVGEREYAQTAYIGKYDIIISISKKKQ
jgi:DNA-binding CsgD family transcriptional regulator